ncbi:uncharacterized protein LOC115589839 isoform X2 [Sparus aurata]|uniref:uncharacterized protein LOC115589839 isoform X2 n=1 Tax=Sparus aurata TaxID=8175 RepID=UPI0011C18C9A|nr:uncharacterized protein LOC115589839 isoform X2 [Sparus aurata]
MLSRRLLFGILLLLVVLSVAYTDSDRPEGEDNPCPVSPDNRNMVRRLITTIKGKDGDTVILPCSTKNKTDLSYDRVEWFKGMTTENKPIHKYVRRSDPPQTQRDDFKDRTSLSEEGLHSGDCSLNLRVKKSDSGSYYCCVPGRLYCPVNLEEEDSSKMHQNVTVSPVKPPNGTDGLNKIIGGVVGGVLGVGALIIIIALAYRYREQLMNYCSGMKPTNQQIYQVVPLQDQLPPPNQDLSEANR